MINETWFLLYNGESEDGMGSGKYYARTTDKNIAKQHWGKIKNNPYSTGKVVAVTDTKEQRIIYDYDWNDYKQELQVNPTVDFRSLCKELVDDLDLWMEYDGQPSRLPTEYRNSLELIYKVRRILKETK